jgi:hypothetical protein
MSHPVSRTHNRHRTSPQMWVAAFTLAVAVVAATTPAANAPELNGTAPVMTEPGLHQYRAMRRMHAMSERFDHEGWMDAWTEFDAAGFRYEIVAERGSDTVRNKVLRALLKREQELIAQGDFGRGELTAENYQFGAETAGREGVRYILIKPERKDVMLIDGRMVLSAEGELLRVEGLLAKNPSFWTSQVYVTRHYSRVDGVRVPISTESLAKVKLAGRSRLDVTYEYESVNGRPVRTAQARPASGASASAR